MYKVIIFDFFGVFCTPPATSWFKKTSKANASGLVDFQALCTKSDLGKITKEDFYKESSRMTGISLKDVEEGIEAEVHINGPLVKCTEDLIKAGYRIACLSNGSHEWTLDIIKKHGLGNLFERVILSSDLGIVKPDPEIYRYTLKALDIGPHEAIFVDDRKANTEAAENLGVYSFVFSDTETFVKDLEEVIDNKN